jgi:hypothetical protein
MGARCALAVDIFNCGEFAAVRPNPFHRHLDPLRLVQEGEFKTMDEPGKSPRTRQTGKFLTTRQTGKFLRLRQPDKFLEGALIVAIIQRPDDVPFFLRSEMKVQRRPGIFRLGNILEHQLA